MENHSEDEDGEIKGSGGRRAEGVDMKRSRLDMQIYRKPGMKRAQIGIISLDLPTIH